MCERGEGEKQWDYRKTSGSISLHKFQILRQKAGMENKWDILESFFAIRFSKESIFIFFPLFSLFFHCFPKMFLFVRGDWAWIIILALISFGETKRKLFASDAPCRNLSSPNTIFYIFKKDISSSISTSNINLFWWSFKKFPREQKYPWQHFSIIQLVFFLKFNAQ